MQKTRGARLVGPLVPLALLLTGCGESAESLAAAVEGAPGVVDVRVGEEDVGDDDIPFASPAQQVKVTMARDASADEVQAVFDAYDSAIDDGDVGLVEVRLEGVQAALASGEHVHVTTAEVEDLLAAGDRYLSYRRQAYPTLPSVEIELRTGDFATVLATADGYAVPGARLDLVEVTSGDLFLGRDAVNEDLAVTSARERVVADVEDRFGLVGATVTGRGPLRIDVARAQRAAVEDFVDAHPDAETIGHVVVV